MHIPLGVYAAKWIQVLDAASFPASKAFPVIIVLKQKLMQAHMQSN